MDTIKATIGALLHDIGKLAQRAGGDRKTHSVIGAEYLAGQDIKDSDISDCVRYHHAADIKTARGISDYAYIAYIADNIAAASQRRPTGGDESGWDAKTPLASVFNLLNIENANRDSVCYYKPATLSEKTGVCYPVNERPVFDQYFYAKIQDDFTESLRGFELTGKFTSSLLDISEATLSFVPSSTAKSEVADISLYDHLKLTAALAACIAEYTKDAGCDNYRALLFDNAEAFYSEPFMSVLSADISGIQDFIYKIHSEDALKMLRARSFYLELFTENIIDEVLTKTGLTRANLLYSGGGHFYLMLPNTRRVLDTADDIFKETNAWLLDKFGAALYIAYAAEAATAYRLGMEQNGAKNKDTGGYAGIWSALSKKITAKKMNRYTPADIRALNNRHKAGRECRVCKQTGDDETCPLCRSLIAASKRILRVYAENEEDTFFIISEDKNGGLPLSKDRYAHAYTKTELIKALDTGEPIVRYYGKNAFYAGDKLSTRLWVGDYCQDKEISNYAEQADGIPRIGVLRMDADNLGKAFSKGFDHSGGIYNTLSRYAAFSRLLSMFFKRYINTLLNEKPAKITVIYAGGDDMFLLGAWNDIIEAARDIREKFGIYTQNKLTLSAGLALYPGKYPIHVMARETGGLESCAKEYKNGAKDAVCLFTPELCFTWAELESVFGKRDALTELFGADYEKGNSFLYKLLQYINDIEKEEKDGLAKMSLARFAYLIARAEPETDDTKRKKAYRDFSKRLYEQMQDAHHRRELKAAVYLYVYANRKRSDKNDDYK